MILEGFEIENWSCIRKVSVSGLPATGVIVLHGPNRTGKSSIVQALRACLMDYASNSTALKSWYPKGTGEKPVVTVTFRANGASYRITKHFGSSKSEFTSQTSAGAWRVETTSAAESHQRMCALAGGDDSAKGLHQLLWLTQAEYRLPEAKKFDASVQAQLRGILGVLQTPLDDRFIEQVRKRWNNWFSGQRKVGKQHEIKNGCTLAVNLARLDTDKKELQENEGKFSEVEGWLRQATALETGKVELDRQLLDRKGEQEALREEHRQSQERIRARQQAEQDCNVAALEQIAAVTEQRQRADAAQRCVDDENALGPAQQRVELAGQSLASIEARKTQLRTELAQQREQRRELAERANRIAARLKRLASADQLTAALSEVERAESIVQDIAQIDKYLADHPAPDKKTLEILKENRGNAARLQANLAAAAMSLTIYAETGAGAAQVAVDGGRPQDVTLADAPSVYAVRRRAELVIQGWGRAELSRGGGTGDLDQIEGELRKCEEEFATAVAPLGITPTDPRALDLLLERAAVNRSRTDEFANKKKELKRAAPLGLAILQARAAELKANLAVIDVTDTADRPPLPAEPSELDRLATSLKQQMEASDANIKELEGRYDEAEKCFTPAQREDVAAREILAGSKAGANRSREELGRLRSDEQINSRVEAAARAVEEANTRLMQTELTDRERTIDDRLEAAENAVRALEQQSRDDTRKYDVLKGLLQGSEGLHASRSSLAARVDELTRLTERESLEKDAVDRLYALFEECREKQLGTLMGPIHDRVLDWMRVLDIGDYQKVGFNDAFLPEKLLTRDGTAEFSVEDESTGAQEQIGMLVRLALGSTLASTAEPALALLDDPLTHCDFGRLNKMRVILRRAANGDQNLSPPAGPLQIMIFTCHPEWFRDERATVIDLEDPTVMTRRPV